MEIRMFGPLTGADARAKRQPPTADSPVASAASTTMNVKRKGRATESCGSCVTFLLELRERGLCLRGFGRRRVDGNDLRQDPPGLVPVASVHRDGPDLIERLAPRRVGCGRLLVPGN